MPRFSSLCPAVDRRALSFEMSPMTLCEIVSVTNAHHVVAVALERFADVVEFQFAPDNHIGRAVSGADRGDETAASAQHLGLGPRGRLIRRERIFTHAVRDALAECTL